MIKRVAKKKLSFTLSISHVNYKIKQLERHRNGDGLILKEDKRRVAVGETIVFAAEPSALWFG
jgi:hypothetical protein